MRFLLLSLMCRFVVVVSSDCVSAPLKGHGVFVEAMGNTRVTCSTETAGECVPSIVADSQNCNNCYSSVLLEGNYTLLGGIYCEGQPSGGTGCLIHILGDVSVGCCGALVSEFKFSAAQGSAVSIGDKGLLKLRTVEILDNAKLIVGNGVTLAEVSIFETYLSNISIGIDSTLSVRSSDESVEASLNLQRSNLFVGNESNFQWTGTQLSIEGSQVSLHNSVFEIKSVAFGLLETIQATMVESNFMLTDVLLQWRSSLVESYGGRLNCNSDSYLQLTNHNLTLRQGSEWFVNNSFTQMRSVDLKLQPSSKFIVDNCDLKAVASLEIPMGILIGDNSTLHINSNLTDDYYCKINGSIRIPPNVYFSEADVAEIICRIGSRPKVSGLKDAKPKSSADAVKSKQMPLMFADTHVSSCPFPIVSTTAKPPDSSVSTEASPMTTTTSATATVRISVFLVLLSSLLG